MENGNASYLKRREFIKKSTMAASSFFIVPRYVLGGRGYTPPSDRLNIGSIGIGGKARIDIDGVSDENIAALCDVDQYRASQLVGGFTTNAYQAFPNARRYEDFREMLETEDDLDGVIICTPDHVHAIATLKAIEKGVSVYTQKPLTHSIEECRKLVLRAGNSKVITQMGIQNHGNEGPRILNELVWQGEIGKVQEVCCWTDRPVWPQGVKLSPSPERIPSTLNWDLWLGPLEFKEYSSAYVPFNWRGWWEFGEGALGDMGCHLIDYAHWALKFSSVISVEASSTPTFGSSIPLSSQVTYNLKSELTNSIIKLNWYDGGLKPAIPIGLQNKSAIDLWKEGSAVMLKGEKGILLYGHKYPKPILLVNGKEREYSKPKERIPRSPGFYKEWTNAIKGSKETPTANFDYSGPLTEIVLLGVVAIRDKRKILWDAENMKITNVQEANNYLKCNYREGWDFFKEK